FVVESPAKCSKIQGFLGPGWKVIATMGHIRALQEELEAIGIDRGFEAKFEFVKEKAKAISQLKEAAANATKVYLASDDDREGEAISYSVAILLKLNITTNPRCVFHEITEQAVKQAVANPRTIDMNRVNAQQARSILDMMVGFTISPLLWKYVGHGLSAGRCQTPALRLLVDREREIQNFKGETTWRLKGNWTIQGLETPAHVVEDLEDQESARNYLENVHKDTRGEVVEAGTHPHTESPPNPLITSTLQQEASALFGSQPKNTMKSAQRLYEAGHITYMRTDSAVLSEEAVKEAQAYVTQMFGETYIGTKGKAKTKAKGKKAADSTAQEAHEAIRPTHINIMELPSSEDWSAVDRKIYKLIWQRTIQSVMAPATSEERVIDFHATADPDDFTWRASWTRMVFPGWKKVGQAAVNLDGDDDQKEQASDALWKKVSTFEVGQQLNWTSLNAEPYETKPPARYTEATLVRELEKRGIGRPSTFATLVGTILEKQYAEKEDRPGRDYTITFLKLLRPNQWPPTEESQTKKIGAEKQKMIPTSLGMSAQDFCVKEFANLFDYTFTKTMESRLDSIAKGEEPWKQLCQDTWDSYKERYEVLKKGKSDTATAPARERIFEGGVKAVISKKGPLLLKEGSKKGEATFYGWPQGVSFQDISQAQVTEFLAKRQQELSGAELGIYNDIPVIKKKGPYGDYAEWNGTKVPFKEGDTFDSIVEKLDAKGQSVLHTLGPFE
ncbi:MAG: type I DNA topoisomerase, partial [Flavobacteriia bacterium]|nr:type I DNA topoisomerase [Flavobacteriia bacterium]